MEENNVFSGDWSALTTYSENNYAVHYSFDFWNTIVKSNRAFKYERARFIKDFIGEEYTIEQINLAFSKVGSEYNSAVELGEAVIPPAELNRQVLDFLNFFGKVDIDFLLCGIEKLFFLYPPILEKGFLNILTLIKGVGRTVSLTSNTAFISGETITKFLNLTDLGASFDFLLFSDQVGYGKPHGRIFDELVIKTKTYHSTILPIDIVHIGDNYDADIIGAQLKGINAFHLILQNEFLYPRFSAYSIIDKNNLPISAESYSRFKFGDLLIAQKYASELFEYFISNHADWLEDNNTPILIFSSPYLSIPTSSFYMTRYFFELVKNYFTRQFKFEVSINLGKINRCQTYTEDYGSLNSKQRYDLIKNDTYEFSEEPAKNSRLIFVDDISITGTHQRVIENLMKAKEYNHKSLFLYYAKLDNPTIDPVFENELNYYYVNSMSSFLEVLNMDSFGITTRAIKYILKLSDSDFDQFIQFLNFNNKIDLIEKFHLAAKRNDYNNIEDYKNNYSKLSNFSMNI